MDSLKCIQLPAGNALDWDITTLTDEQLDYEYHLCYECLYGAYIAGFPVLKGLMNEDHISFGVGEHDLAKARAVWLDRLRRAEDELFERKLI